MRIWPIRGEGGLGATARSLRGGPRASYGPVSVTATAQLSLVGTAQAWSSGWPALYCTVCVGLWACGWLHAREPGPEAPHFVVLLAVVLAIIVMLVVKVVSGFIND